MCFNCNGIDSYFKGQCAVCQELDKDNSEKDVAYCKICEVNLCKKCNGAWLDRVEVFFKVRILKRAKSFLGID